MWTATQEATATASGLWDRSGRVVSVRPARRPPLRVAPTNNAMGGVEWAHKRRLSMGLSGGDGTPQWSCGDRYDGVTRRGMTGQRWQPRSPETIEDLPAETKQAGESAVDSIQEARQLRNAQDARRRGRPALLSTGPRQGSKGEAGSVPDHARP